ncbi:MAG: GMC oxidoreductase [Cyanobacteriota bacterium]|nr:GMC oxidoreductase [Cyanobacteriota bacterium]
MFVNFSEEDTPETFLADICVVGSGVMGLALTSHLLRHTPLRILLVEQGGLMDTDALSAVPEELNSGDVTSGVNHSRAMGFGGSSRRWGGEALPFLPLDLSERPLLSPLGPWPITYGELQPYYQMAADFLALSATPFETDLWRDPSLQQWFGPSHPLEINFSKHSPIAYLANQYKGRIGRSRRVTCLLEAKVVDIQLSTSGARAEAVRVRSKGGKEALLRTTSVVLCGGGIENPRLLLASRQGERRGIGNDHDLVGRYYQDHVGFYGARLRPLNRRLFNHLFASFRAGKQKYLPKLQLTPRQQSTQGVLNVTGNIAFEESEQSLLQTLRRLRRRLTGAPRDPGEKGGLDDLARLLQAPGGLLPIVSSALRGRVHFPEDAAFFLIGNAETEPLANSRILLSDQVDDYNLARPRVHWLVSDRTLEALRTYFGAVKVALEGAGIAEVALTPSLNDPTLNWKAKAYSLYHHMGATRMAHSPRQGVVDGDCRVHGVANLYVVGTSVLPTGSASNPSFTALALTFRLGEHLSSRFRA